MSEQPAPRKGLSTLTIILLTVVATLVFLAGLCGLAFVVCTNTLMKSPAT